MLVDPSLFRKRSNLDAASPLMEDSLFVVAYLFAIFNINKTITLIFNIKIVKKSIYTEESRLLGYKLE